MHPPLHRPHPKCAAVRRAPTPSASAARVRHLPSPSARAQLVDLLVACHDEKPYAKFWGACNDAKLAMDVCFRDEKEEKRRANLEKARAFDARRRKAEAER